jgi:hypothetical protein
VSASRWQRLEALFHEARRAERSWTRTRRLAELEEQAGDPRAATASYTRLLELWRDADPSLQSTLADVRLRIARRG